MSANQQVNLTPEEAVKILENYGCVQHKKVESEQETQKIAQALKIITILSESQNFGICADSVQEGLKALKSYLNALGYTAQLSDFSGKEINQGVYIKFSSQSQSYYVDNYPGDYRGVLISCYSEENQQICGTYGHFPLNLFNGV